MSILNGINRIQNILSIISRRRKIINIKSGAWKSKQDFFKKNKNFIYLNFIV